MLHAAGVVHRDLKPANLFLAEGSAPRWKILDYGVSKLRESTMTEDQVVGTPGAGFGPGGEGYFRLSAFNTRDNVDEALRRIKAMAL